jgi:hypothetical protein
MREQPWTEEAVRKYLEDNYVFNLPDALRHVHEQTFEALLLRGLKPVVWLGEFFEIVEKTPGSSERERIEIAIPTAATRGIRINAEMRRFSQLDPDTRGKVVDSLHFEYQRFKRRQHPLLERNKRYGVRHFQYALLTKRYALAAAIYVTSDVRNRRIIEHHYLR